MQNSLDRCGSVNVVTLPGGIDAEAPDGGTDKLVRLHDLKEVGIENSEH